MNIKVGSTVKLKPSVKHDCPKGREDNNSAKVLSFLDDIEGGVYLDRDLHGCKYWNVQELELLK